MPVLISRKDKNNATEKLLSRLQITHGCVFCKRCLLRYFSSLGFWGLVNNAGISTFGETGWLSMEKYEKFTDVNLLGSIRTTLAFLPLLRKYKGNANPLLFRVVE